ncbi:hypothetical protein Sru01_61700 [Sphaerisporangium rufum]|uniref:Uncharacterized protein n=1 Tax=Sphaerisporangium rufum TaxID=1381558 RepID=A0A919R8J1_9ACTN|nr:hypothetical protein [Sphaerisporangium rufum]GII81188.1 hypothetical protein Sru01_61700 [Sphaerisporangium rufum]
MNARDNPFPSAPAARLSGSYDLFATGPRSRPGRAVTIETDAVRAVAGQLGAYLDQSTGVPSRGRALALVGDLGTGKSHIARDLARTVTAHPSAPLLWLIDEPLWDFGAIYRDRLVSGLKDQKAAFFDVLLDYYSDVTADSIDRSPLLRQVVTGLRDRRLDPQAVIEAYALSEAAIRRDLERRLQMLTEHGKFSAALTLLLFPGIQDQVWDWLMGQPPSTVLHERGIDTPIDTVSKVFDALAVFAFLYGQAGRKFVLVIDMLEKVFEWPDDRRSDFTQAFEKLVNVYVNAGGLLVFCTLPEVLGRFGESLHERIVPIRPTLLTGAQSVELVHAHLHPQQEPAAAAEAAEEALDDDADDGTDATQVTQWLARRSAAGTAPARRPRGPDIAPFTEESVHYINRLAGGVPRRVLKLCHHAWATAAAEGGPPPREVDDRVVRAAARKAFEKVTREDLRKSIEGVLSTGPWRFEPSPVRFARRSAGAAGDVDFWVLIGRTGSAIAVVTTDSVLQDEQVDRLRQTVEAARRDTGAAPCEVLVAVNGYISTELRLRLADATGSQPIVYSDRSFEHQVRETVRELAERLSSSGRDSTLDLIRDHLEGIAFQQTSVLQRLQRIDGRVEQLDTATAARLGELWQLAEMSGDPPAAGGRRAGVRRRLPHAVQRHFDRAFDVIGLLSGVPASFREVFDPAGEDRPRRLSFTVEQFQAVGVAVLVQKLVEAFQDSVGEWVRQARTVPGEPAPTAEQERRLRTICRSYEITAEMLPVFRLESLATFGPFTEGPDPLDRSARTFRRAEAQEVLTELAERVFTSAMDHVRA